MRRPPHGQPQRGAPGMSRRLTLLFAVAGGAAVGNLYWAQPLLTDIATSLGVPTGIASLLVAIYVISLGGAGSG